MKEAIKGVILGQGEHKLMGKKVYKYLVGVVLITDTPIEGVDLRKETVILSEKTNNELTNFLSGTQKYKLNENLGDIDMAMLTISNMSLDEIKANSLS